MNPTLDTLTFKTHTQETTSFEIELPLPPSKLGWTSVVVKEEQRLVSCLFPGPEIFFLSFTTLCPPNPCDSVWDCSYLGKGEEAGSGSILLTWQGCDHAVGASVGIVPCCVGFPWALLPPVADPSGCVGHLSSVPSTFQETHVKLSKHYPQISFFSKLEVKDKHPSSRQRRGRENVTALVGFLHSPLLQNLFFFSFLKNGYIFLRERQNVIGGGTEKKGDTESKAGSRL